MRVVRCSEVRTSSGARDCCSEVSPGYREFRWATSYFTCFFSFRLLEESPDESGRRIFSTRSLFSFAMSAGCEKCPFVSVWFFALESCLSRRPPYRMSFSSNSSISVKARLLLAICSLALSAELESPLRCANNWAPKSLGGNLSFLGS